MAGVQEFIFGVLERAQAFWEAKWGNLIGLFLILTGLYAIVHYPQVAAVTDAGKTMIGGGLAFLQKTS